MRLVNAWTGGQYSLYRAVFGLYLAGHFATLLPWAAELFSSRGMLPDASASPLYPLFPNVLFVLDAPGVAIALVAAGALASLAFAAGFRDRPAALLIWYVWACLFSRNPLIANPSLPFVGFLLLLHALLPRAPYGAWDARGRSDPGGAWRLPPELFAVVWIVMALGYSYSGYTKLASPSWLDGSALARVLENPLARPTLLRELLLALPQPLLHAATWGALALELCFAPLALLRLLRPWLWLALLGMHVGLMTLIDFADLSFGMVVLHLLAFDPAWLPPRGERGRVFYDGGCGLCHRAVRFVLAEDREARFRFAPIESASFAAAVPEAERAELPDSIILVLDSGARAVRSGSVLEIGRGLGGLWRALAACVRLVPQSWRDAAYDAVAAGRRRWFAAPPEACPLVPPELRSRFES